MKKIFHDIIPREKRSIRNIPLLRKDMPEVVHSSLSPNFNDSEIEPAVEVVPVVKNAKRISHSMDGIRSKHSMNRTNGDEQSKMNKDTANLGTVDLDIEDDEGEEYGGTIEPAFISASAKDFKTGQDDEDSNNDRQINSNFEEWNKHQKKSYVRATVVLVSLIGICFFLLSIYLGGATISINPVRHDVVLQETKIALNTISHETVTTKSDSSEEVTANGTAKVDRKATGKVILYNAYNSSVQKLVAETRLETPNGLIYKLKTAVSIPGQKIINGKPVPGSVEVEVEASETGEKYNQGFKDFNVVAYKGSDRYEGIYGRSKTALSNGFSGTVPNIAQKDIASSTSRIKEKINVDVDEFFSKKAKEKGSNYVYIPSTKKVIFGEVQNNISKDGKTAILKIEATATAVLFDSTTLFAEIIKNQSEQITEQIGSQSGFDTSKEIVYTGDFSKLNVSLSGETSLQVTGTTSISSAIDITKVTKAVSGLSKEQAIGAIKRLVELETIEIDIRPWWNKKLPSVEKIEIKTEN